MYLHVRAFDYTIDVLSGRVGIPLTGFTTPDGWLSLPQLTVLSRSAIVVKVFGGVCVVTLLFGFFCRCRGFCHRTESDLFLFLFFFLQNIDVTTFLIAFTTQGCPTCSPSDHISWLHWVAMLGDTPLTHSIL